MKSNQQISEIPQFGNKPENFTTRISAYGVIFNDKKELVVLEVNGKYFLPGGGIDEGEDPEEAVRRETMEEAGYEVGDLEFVGKANQYFDMTKLGPLKKEGAFFVGKIKGEKIREGIEEDHHVRVVSVEHFLNSTANDFYKWAVKEVL